MVVTGLDPTNPILSSQEILEFPTVDTVGVFAFARKKTICLGPRRYVLTLMATLRITATSAPCDSKQTFKV